MPIKVVIEKVLDETWVSDEELDEISEEDIVYLIFDDIQDFMDGAAFEITKTKNNES